MILKEGRTMSDFKLVEQDEKMKQHDREQEQISTNYVDRYGDGSAFHSTYKKPVAAVSISPIFYYLAFFIIAGCAIYFGLRNYAHIDIKYLLNKEDLSKSVELTNEQLATKYHDEFNEATDVGQTLVTETGINAKFYKSKGGILTMYIDDKPVGIGMYKGNPCYDVKKITTGLYTGRLTEVIDFDFTDEFTMRLEDVTEGDGKKVIVYSNRETHEAFIHYSISGNFEYMLYLKDASALEHYMLKTEE